MKIEKLDICKETFNINLKFYFFLKYLVKAKITDRQARIIFEIHSLSQITDFKPMVLEKIETIFGSSKKGFQSQSFIGSMLDIVENQTDIELFMFSLKLYMIKDLLLQEAKTKDLLDISKLNNLDPLSLKYDKVTLFSPYSTRVSGALLSLMFFDRLENNETNFISKDAEEWVESLSLDAMELKNKGLEPNQIFMLMFNESINQSIISDSGSNYEDRILSVLTKIGIDKTTIKKMHDKDDASTEFDFFFELEGKKYGIGAKRTLRERYKQFIKTAQITHIDVMIEITLGLDLTEEKAKSIRNHSVYLFVSDEVYEMNTYLRSLEGVFSTKSLTIKTLSSLAKNI